MVNLVRVYVILSRLRLIAGGGATVPGYRVGVMGSRFVCINLVLSSLGRITRRLVSAIPTAPTFGVVGLMGVYVFLGSLRSSAGRSIYRSTFRDYNGRYIPSCHPLGQSLRRWGLSRASWTSFLPGEALIALLRISLPSRVETLEVLGSLCWASTDSRIRASRSARSTRADWSGPWNCRL